MAEGTLYQIDNAPLVDPLTARLRTQHVLEDLLHAGSLYTAFRNVPDLGVGASIDLVFTTPEEPAYIALEWEYVTTGPGRFEFWEDPVAAVVGGNLVGMRNNKRDVATTSSITITHTPTGVDTALATPLAYEPIGSSGGFFLPGSGGSGASRKTWVLKPDTKYLARLFNSNSGAESFTMVFHWAQFMYTTDTYYFPSKD